MGERRRCDSGAGVLAGKVHLVPSPIIATVLEKIPHCSLKQKEREKMFSRCDSGVFLPLTNRQPTSSSSTPTLSWRRAVTSSSSGWPGWSCWAQSWPASCHSNRYTFLSLEVMTWTTSLSKWPYTISTWQNGQHATPWLHEYAWGNYHNLVKVFHKN